MRELTRADFCAPPLRRLREGVGHKPDLTVHRVGSEQVVLKDYSRKRGVWRGVIGVVCTGREARALRALAGVEGVPRFRGRPDRHSVAMAFVPGRLARKDDPALAGNRDFVEALERVVRQMHARGVVHLDLKHRSNLMVTPDGRPVVIDFEAALVFNCRRRPGRLAVRLLGRLDRLAVQNWKRRFLREDLSDGDARDARLARSLRGWWLPGRFIRALRDVFEHGRRRRTR
jgi:hypothetical protein